ncbi:hypothetical protein ACIF83_20390 [Streptomyces sp. NPDC085866]|uniref:hypothetical protein n=1 Tax=Streptomyces sp. NPDC085866 TaxID=3365736 RepID=UPI0037D8F676
MKSGPRTHRPSCIGLLTATALTGALAGTLLALPEPASAAAVTLSAVQCSTRKSPYGGRQMSPNCGGCRWLRSGADA